MDRRIGVWYPIQLLRLNLAPPIGVELRHFPNGEFCLFLCGAGALITNSRLTQVLHEKNKRAGRGVKGREEAVRRRHLRTPGNVLLGILATSPAHFEQSDWFVESLQAHSPAVRKRKPFTDTKVSHDAGHDNLSSNRLAASPRGELDSCTEDIIAFLHRLSGADADTQPD